MKKNNIIKRQSLINQLGFDLIEVAKIFSQETLNSMMMKHVIGGNDGNNTACAVCAGSNCTPLCGCVSVSSSVSVEASVSTPKKNEK